MTSFMASEDAPLSLDPEELAFFKAQTKIEHEDELKKHITDIQAKAFKVFPYPCIRAFGFTKFSLCRMPTYQRILKLAEERKDAILLDVGCCFGIDLRKTVADGWPVSNVVGFELRKEFWGYGHDLCLTTSETFPAAFIAGDIFDPAMISLRSPFHCVSEALPPRPDLKSLTSLTPLQGHVSVIYTSAFFHLFDEPQQFQVARLLASLLSPLPGSTILGGHVAQRTKGTINSIAHSIFCHSPESWKEMWYDVFGKDASVRAEVELAEASYKRSGEAEPEKAWWMIWSVTRL